MPKPKMLPLYGGSTYETSRSSDSRNCEISIHFRTYPVSRHTAVGFSPRLGRGMAKCTYRL
jgi:hypothetical protein